MKNSMETTIKYIKDTPLKNIVYIAIGPGNKNKQKNVSQQYPGTYQYPPFLEKLVKEYPELTVQIIIIDPKIETNPQIISRLNLMTNKFDIDHCISNKFDVIVVREDFDFSNKPENSSNKVIQTVIEKILQVKEADPKKTHLLFVHDFSGHNKEMDAITNDITFLVRELDEVSQSCIFPNILMSIDNDNHLPYEANHNLDNPLFYPQVIKSPTGCLQIFNPYRIPHEELGMLFMYPLHNKNIGFLALNTVANRLNKFIDDHFETFRQVKQYLKPQSDFNKSLPKLNYNSPILKDIIRLENIIDVDLQNSQYCDSIRMAITTNLDNYLKLITQFSNIYTMDHPDLFTLFIAYCSNSNYEIVEAMNIFNDCVFDMNKLILNHDPSQYRKKVNDYVVKYITVNKQFPLFMRLLLPDNNQVPNHDIINFVNKNKKLPPFIIQSLNEKEKSIVMPSNQNNNNNYTANTSDYWEIEYIEMPSTSNNNNNNNNDYYDTNRNNSNYSNWEPVKIFSTSNRNNNNNNKSNNNYYINDK